MEEKEERGISIGDIFRVIFSQKWLALIIAALVTVVGAVSLYFYGQKKVEYSVSFVLQLPNTGDASATTYTYPDGESFYFTDLISSENLKLVAPEGIEVDKMIKNNDISISRTVDKVDDDSTDGVYDLNYTIKVKAKYFEDEDAARDFIEALTLIPREHIGKMEINYDQSLTTSKTAITYAEQLSLLRSQAAYIQSNYNALVGAYGNEFIVSDGRTLAQCKAEVDTYLSQDLFTALTRTAEEKSYIKSGDKNSEEKLKYESDLYSNKLVLERAEDTLKALTEFQSGTGSIIYDEIIALNREIATLNQQIKILNNYIASFDSENKIAPAEFEAEVAKVEAEVTRFTEEIKPVASYVYGKVTKINYLSSKVVEVEGGTSLVMSVAIGLVAGLVLAAIVAYIVGYTKLKKAKLAMEGVRIYPEAQLQLAAAQDEEEKKEEEKDE